MQARGICLALKSSYRAKEHGSAHNRTFCNKIFVRVRGGTDFWCNCLVVKRDIRYRGRCLLKATEGGAQKKAWLRGAAKWRVEMSPESQLSVPSGPQLPHLCACGKGLDMLPLRSYPVWEAL